MSFHISIVHSKVMNLLLLNYCLLLLPLFVGVLCLVLALLFSTLCPSSFAIILMGKRELLPCDSQCYVALPCRSAVCDCGIS